MVKPAPGMPGNMRNTLSQIVRIQFAQSIKMHLFGLTLASTVIGVLVSVFILWRYQFIYCPLVI